MNESMRDGGSWIAADPFSQNETYLGQRLLFQRAGSVETDLMDVVSGEKARKILRRTFGGALLVFLIFGLVATIAAGMSDGFGSESPGGAVGPLAALLAIVGPIAWIVVHLFVPETKILSDWNLILDGKAEVADSAYAVVFRCLREDHDIPAEIEPRRMRIGPPVRGVRNLLRVRIGKYYTLVSVFAFGKDLYLGWTLWRRQVPVLVVLRWLASLAGGDPGFSGLVDVEPVKAMRETVHNALRRAIEAAVIGREVSIVEAFGHDLPIEVTAPGAETGYGRDAAPAPVRQLTVVMRTAVFASDGTTPMGHVEPGFCCELLGDDESGLVVRDSTGTVAVLKDRSSVRWS